jgi:hypothetical protein
VDVKHGTPEGFRLHKKLEHDPCSSCAAAMTSLLDGDRRFRASVRGVPVPPELHRTNFSAYQRSMWPQRRAAERAAELVEHPPLPPLPPVVTPAEPLVGLESWLPSSPRSNLKAFRAAGWQARLTRAAGPRIAANGIAPPGKEVVYTIALAAQRADQRVVMVWEFTPSDNKWKLDDSIHNRRGMFKTTDLKEILDDQQE